MLYSNRSTPMLKIVEDTCGRHDFLMTPCSLKMFQLVNDNEEHHPSCHENLAKNLKRFNVHEDQISTTLNIFMNVSVNSDGGIQILPPKSRAQDFVVFKALIDLFVGLTACSHEETNAGECKEIHYQVLNEFTSNASIQKVEN